MPLSNRLMPWTNREMLNIKTNKLRCAWGSCERIAKYTCNRKMTGVDRASSAQVLFFQCCDVEYLYSPSSCWSHSLERLKVRIPARGFSGPIIMPSDLYLLVLGCLFVGPRWPQMFPFCLLRHAQKKVHINKNQKSRHVSGRGRKLGWCRFVRGPRSFQREWRVI